MADKYKDIRIAKFEVAEICESLLRDPQKFVGNLAHLFEFCKRGHADIQRLAIISLTEVFRDIIPAYKISDSQDGVQLSKEAAKVRSYEGRLLKHHRRFVSYLRQFIQGAKQKNKNLDIGPVATTAVQCTCRLFDSSHHFNFAREMMFDVVSLMNHRNLDVSNRTRASIERLFRKPKADDLTLEAVRFLSKLIKKCNFRVHQSVMNCFLALPVRSTKVPKSQKKRKRSRDKTLNRDLRLGDATDDPEYQAKLQSRILEEIFVVYFSSLKCYRKIDNALLGGVIRGLNKFSKVMNVDLLLDLAKNLRIIASDEEHISLNSTLDCIHTSLSLLQHRNVDLDMTEYCSALYNRIFDLALPKNHVHSSLMLQCISLVLRYKALSDDVVRKFVAQLYAVSLHVPPYIAMAILKSIDVIMKLHPQLFGQAEMWSSNDMDCEDMTQLQHKCCTTLLRTSYHPLLSKYSTALLTPSNEQHHFEGIAPRALLETYDSSRGDFKPAVF